MAEFVVEPTPLVPLSAAATDFAVPASSFDCAENDYVVLFLQNGATAGTISEKTTSAWTLTTLNVTTGCRMAFAYLKVGASPLADVTFQANSGIWQGAYAVLRDVDLTTLNDGTITTTDHGSVNSAASDASLTPTNDYALALYFTGNRGSGEIRYRASDVVGHAAQNNTDGSTAQNFFIGSVQQGTKAATAKTWYAGSTSRSGSIVIPIKNASGGGLAKHGTANITRVGWLGNFAAHDTTLTWGLPDNATDTPTSWDGTGKINGISVSNTIATLDTSRTIGGSPFGTYTGISCNNSTAGAWVGRKASFSSAIDMSGALFACEFAMTTLTTPIGAEGAILAFRDSGGNWAAFQLTNKLMWQAGRPYTVVFDLSGGAVYASGGTIDWSDIVSITPLYHRAGSVTTARELYLKNWLLVGKATLSGGSADFPLTIKFLDKVLNGAGYRDLCQRSGPSILVRSDVQVGDGTLPTYWDATATMLASDDAYDPYAQNQSNIAAGSIDIIVKASASDTINEIASAISCGAAQNYSIDATSSTSASYDFSGRTFVGLQTFTGLTGIPIASATFSRCGTVDMKGINATGCTWTKPTGTAAVTYSESGATVSGCTTNVSGTAAAYHISLGASVTAITLVDHTFTGTAATDKIYVAATTGTVTITISGTTSLVAGDVTSAGATVVIAAPEPTLDATVLANSRVLLYNDTTAAELDNTAPAGTSWSKTITSGATAGDTLTLWVFKEGYEEFSTSFLYTGADQTILVAQVVHEHIDAMRTTLGITDYTTITEYSLDTAGTVEIDADDADGNTLKKRLAIWYNGILTTADGATYLRGAISVLATNQIRINVDVLDLLVENVSATYGLNFTDTDVRLWRSDGTPIYKAASAAGSIQNDYSGVPDTVETGVSGLTGAESSALTDTAATIAARLDATISSRATPADVPSANDVAQEVVAGITF